MNKLLPKGLLLLVVAVCLTGCPGLNIPGISNSITVHNGYETFPIAIFGVSIINCGDALPSPANVLTTDLAPGGDFTISGLQDGEYLIQLRPRRADGLLGGVDTARQTVSGGMNFIYTARQ